MIYTRCLQQQDKADTCGPEGQAFLVDRCCEAYASVADWEGLQQWLQDLKARLDPLRLYSQHIERAPTAAITL